MIFTTLLINLVVIATAAFVLWLVSLLRKDASIVDIFWGPGFALVGWVSFFWGSESGVRSMVLLAMVTLWGLRLGGYLAWRNAGKPEDYRYRAMRERHGDRFPLVSLVTVFGLQGILMWIVSLPLQAGITQARGWHWAATLGLFAWLIGWFFETVGDYQLAHFKSRAENRGRVMDRGLWRYTRHPNYFGDFLVWWGIYFVSIESAAWWWTIVGPVLMSFLLVRVSGVRLLESSLRKRVPGYEEYVRNTSSFLPLPPRRKASAD